MNRKKLISLSQSEILGYGDEYVSINVTKFKKYFFCVLASFGYLLAGFFVGWSSKLLRLQEHSVELGDLNRSQISWIISAFPLGVVIVSLVVYQLYYWIGMKLSMLVASFMVLLSWGFVLVDGNDLSDFRMLMASRIMGGLGCGMIFTLLPTYMKELLNIQNSSSEIVDILITQFGIGICLQYFMDSMSPLHLSIISIIISLFYFIICCLIPESPRYQFYCEVRRKQSYDFEKATKMNSNLWNDEDLQSKSIFDLFTELKKHNLISLIGLILVEQLIGGISILFYMKHFAQLTGGVHSVEWTLKGVGLALIFSIPLSKLCKFSSIQSTTKQIKISSVVIILCMLTLASLCITEGLTGQKVIAEARHLLPVPIFIIVIFFHVAGITRNLWILMQQILPSFSLQLHLRAFNVAISWLVIFGTTKVLPKILYLIGVGYLYAHGVILMVIALVFLLRIIPSTVNLEANQPMPIINSLTSSSCEHTPTASQNSSCNEIQHI